jgi:hypothetical protein
VIVAAIHSFRPASAAVGLVTTAQDRARGWNITLHPTLYMVAPSLANLAARPPAPRSQSSVCAPKAMTRTDSFWLCADKVGNHSIARRHASHAPCTELVQSNRQNGSAWMYTFLVSVQLFRPCPKATASYRQFTRDHFPTSHGIPGQLTEHVMDYFDFHNLE